MPEEPKITMLEFKTVVESFESKLKTISEGIGTIQTSQVEMKGEFHSVKEQIALLHVGQTEIKHMLTRKADQDNVDRLEMRVAKLESKVA